MRYKITCDEAIERVLGELDGPLEEAEFVQRVLQLWPSQAKNPQQSVKSKLNYRSDLLRLEEGRIAPTAYFLNGTLFRLQLNQQECEVGGPLAQRFTGLIPYVALHTPQFIDARTGQRIPCQVVDVGKPETRRRYWEPEFLYNMAPWLQEAGYQPEDSLIVEIRDYNQRLFMLRYEPAADRQEAQIARQNEQMAAALQQVLGPRSLHVFDLVPRLYAALPTRREYPGDPWSLVVRRDSRFSFTRLGSVTLGPAPPLPPGYTPMHRPFPEDDSYTLARQRAQQVRQAELENRFQEFQREYAAARRAACAGLPPSPRAHDEHAGRLPTRRLARRRSEGDLEAFDQYLKQRGQGLSSRQQKRADLERFSEFLAERHHRSLDAADFDLMEEFFFQWCLRTMDKLSRSVLQRLFASLRQFYEYEGTARGRPEMASHIEALSSLKDWAERKLELAQQIPPGDEYEALRDTWLGKPPRRRPRVEQTFFPFSRPFFGPPPGGRR
jgi:hypothetical protein